MQAHIMRESIFSKSNLEVETVEELKEIKLSGDYAKLGGQYYGRVVGTRIYEYCIVFKLLPDEIGERPLYAWRDCREANRSSVRAYLKKLYPNAKICR